jgi:hypothetical protein
MVVPWLAPGSEAATFSPTHLARTEAAANGRDSNRVRLVPTGPDTMRTLFRQVGKSARGLAQSKTLRDRLAGPSGRQLLDCASPLALFLTRF